MNLEHGHYQKTQNSGIHPDWRPGPLVQLPFDWKDPQEQLHAMAVRGGHEPTRPALAIVCCCGEVRLVPLTRDLEVSDA